MIINKKKILIGLLIFFIAVFVFEIFLPKPFSEGKIVYNLEKGKGHKEIAGDLENRGIIKNARFFQFYVAFFGQYSKLQAGNYEFYSPMSIYQVSKKFTSGDIIKNRITIIEGRNLNSISKEFEEKNIYSAEEFFIATEKDWSEKFDFLIDKPDGIGLEGYIFPDTYEISFSGNPDEFIGAALLNFDKKLTQDLREEISRQDKSIFQIVTMASMIEREVKTLDDKNIVSGILWKRIKEGVPLQIDATINYITGKSVSRVSIADTKIDSPYNTYKYYGLPKGPIANPGLDSILAAIFPSDSSYWYYISEKINGDTIFSKTLDDHNLAIAKHLNK